MTQQATRKFFQGFSVSGRQPGLTQGGQDVFIIGVGWDEDDPARPLLHFLQLLLLSVAEKRGPQWGGIH